jgi:hypothetical protein
MMKLIAHSKRAIHLPITALMQLLPNAVFNK